MEIKYEDIKKANESIVTTDIKGKDYAEVNQRIKAFRMLYPEGRIDTELLYDTDGKCAIKAYVFRNVEDEKPLATGTAYEKENSTFINKTSYIENCETSAVGRALGMAGFGIDTSIASAEEVQNAITNQEKVEMAIPEQIRIISESCTEEQIKKITDGFKVGSLADLTLEQASAVIKKLKKEGK